MGKKRKTFSYFAVTMLLLGIGYFGWRGLIRPWQVARGLTGVSVESLVKRLGLPDLVFHGNDELHTSRLVSGGYVFTPFPGPEGESPPGIGWAAYSLQSAPISTSELPEVDDRAYWYDLPLTAGILVYVKNEEVATVYHGGT